MKLSKNTTILAASAIVVLGLVAYFLWMRPTDGETVSVSSSGVTSEVQATFLALAAQLDPIAFNGEVLSDPRFMKLVDIKTVIVPENGGRTDPFAPLPGVVTR